MPEQILIHTNATLQMTFSAGDADAGVTVTITRADGTALATGAATTHVSTGVYAYTLAPQSELDYLTVVWSGAWGGVAQSLTSYAEIVGAYLFTVADARAFGDRVLANATTYLDVDIRAMRERVTDMFQQVCGVSFVPRYGRDELDGTNTDTVEVANRRPRRIIAGSIDGTALTADQIADLHLYPSGRIVWESGLWPWRRQNVVLAYEHGYPSPPADVSRAALTLARYDLVSNDLSDRMISFANDLGQVRLSVPGRDYPTGIPTVDAVLSRYCEAPLLLA